MRKNIQETANCHVFLNEHEREKLESFFLEGAKEIESWPEHWVHGWDEGLSFCRECCEKKVAELLQSEPNGDYCLDGGWGSESDSTPYCETCGKLLEANLTTEGCKSEIDHFEMYGFDVASNDDRRSMHEVIESLTWEPNRDNGILKERLHKLGRTILEKICENTKR